jgi:hypothetical protein
MIVSIFLSSIEVLGPRVDNVEKKLGEMGGGGGGGGGVALLSQ